MQPAAATSCPSSSHWDEPAINQRNIVTTLVGNWRRAPSLPSGARLRQSTAEVVRPAFGVGNRSSPPSHTSDDRGSEGCV